MTAATSPITPTLQDAINAAAGSAQTALGAQLSASASANAAALSATSANTSLVSIDNLSTTISATFAEIQTAQAEVDAALVTAQDVQALLLAQAPIFQTITPAVLATIAAGPVVSINGETGIVTLSFLTANSPALTGVPTAPTATLGTNTTQLATCAYVLNAFNGAALSGIPTAPTASTNTSTTQIATCAFVINQFGVLIATYAPLASPAFTGTPTVPTAPLNTNTGQAASTGFVLGQAATTTPLQNSGSGAVGTSTTFARADHVHPPDTVPFTQLFSTTISGTPTTVSFTNIPQNYGSLFIVLEGVSISASTANIVIDVSTNNGSTWSSSSAGVALPANTTPLNNTLIFHGYALPFGMLLIGEFTVTSTFTSPNVGSPGSSPTSMTAHAGGCNAIRFRASASTLASGTIVVYGQ